MNRDLRQDGRIMGEEIKKESYKLKSFGDLGINSEDPLELIEKLMGKYFGMLADFRLIIKRKIY